MKTSLPRNMDYPSSDANPYDIRQYLEYLLLQKHAVDTNTAVEIASRWEYGRESHLREYSEAQFKHLFGTLGPYLYRSVSEDMARAWHDTFAGFLTVGALFGIVFLLFPLPLLIYKTIAAPRLDRNTLLCLFWIFWISPAMIFLCNRLETRHRSQWASTDWDIMAAFLGIIAFFSMFAYIALVLDDGGRRSR